MKRLLAILVSIVMVLGAPYALAEVEPLGQELNIAVFQGGFGDAYWNAVVELFEKTHEGVTVNMTISPTIADIIDRLVVAGYPPGELDDITLLAESQRAALFGTAGPVRHLSMV